MLAVGAYADTTTTSLPSTTATVTTGVKEGTTAGILKHASGNYKQQSYYKPQRYYKQQSYYKPQGYQRSY
ncbi:unnamed protein product [Schistocephalus solidus]|uniref:Secreted protein n=1 Tax=Schistocephalus solidus TaxID=70667 RepID=A0A183TCN9_SCHSO|nr:unnamed protein product [Schistocephalus solidus]